MKVQILFLLLFTHSFFGSTVLITGANRGIGLAFTKAYLAKGENVFATARKPEEADDLKKLPVRLLQLDLSSSESIRSLADALKGESIDILIHNGAIFSGRGVRPAEITAETMQRFFMVNATGPFLLTSALLENLQLGKEKKVIMISSRFASIENNQGDLYPTRASKTALNQLMRTFAFDLKEEGFIFLALHPGWVKTDMGGQSAPYTPDQSVEKMVRLIDRLKESDSGRFLDLDGRNMPW